MKCTKEVWNARASGGRVSSTSGIENARLAAAGVREERGGGDRDGDVLAGRAGRDERPEARTTTVRRGGARVECPGEADHRDASRGRGGGGRSVAARLEK